jgi:hypothetical protein
VRRVSLDYKLLSLSSFTLFFIFTQESVPGFVFWSVVKHGGRILWSGGGSKVMERQVSCDFYKACPERLIVDETKGRKVTISELYIHNWP